MFMGMLTSYDTRRQPLKNTHNRTGGQGVAGSNPVIPTIFTWSIPDTWVTVHSGDMGNTFGPNGFSIGSSRHVSSSK
jgi:hypothetical protein